MISVFCDETEDSSLLQAESAVRSVIKIKIFFIMIDLKIPRQARDDNELPDAFVFFEFFCS